MERGDGTAPVAKGLETLRRNPKFIGNYWKNLGIVGKMIDFGAKSKEKAAQFRQEWR
jgi:hypothetical protein